MSPRPSRPILKYQQAPDALYPSTPGPFPFASCSNATAAMLSSHVHFPPTPALTQTHVTHSPATYDRAPIVVSDNTCALPERGGRTYSAGTSERKKQAKGSYFHPRAYEACEREPAYAAAPPFDPPPLVPDVSSSSDDSDGQDGAVLTPPGPHAVPPISMHFAKPPTPVGAARSPHSQQEIESAYSFLPHPPSPVRDKDKDRKRRASPARPRLKQSRSGVRRPSIGFAEPPVDDGCLGGF
ncbi:hypothetical protein PLICRDRAFT_377273 [Plicaturopsis crispa FD-325 SS-3]|nr:hypothetical protein PLICRDRAFT_377273 [Plicaturopsis crispa FD-325 SS-3]